MSDPWNDEAVDEAIDKATDTGKAAARSAAPRVAALITDHPVTSMAVIAVVMILAVFAIL